MKDKPVPAFAGISMKWISLILLVVQTVSVILMMRFTRSHPTEGPRYLSSTAVFYAEAIKAIFSFGLLWHENASFRSTAKLVTRSFHWPDFLRMCIPSLLFTVQNNLLFLALSNLSAAVYQVTHQMKILTTAFFSVLILGKSLGTVKWASLVVLTIGVALVQYPRGGDTGAAPVAGNQFIGFVAVAGGCFTSGLGGVYLEKLLKQSELSIWMRNIQLGLSGCIFALVTVLVQDRQAVLLNGFNQGYTPFVWTVILVHALGGLIVAACMKYADNILKCFGNAAAILINCVLSNVILHEFQLDLLFFASAVLVVGSTTVYNLGLPALPLLPMLLRRRHAKKYDDSLAQEV